MEAHPHPEDSSASSIRQTELQGHQLVGQCSQSSLALMLEGIIKSSYCWYTFMPMSRAALDSINMLSHEKAIPAWVPLDQSNGPTTIDMEAYPQMKTLCACVRACMGGWVGMRV